ncbi:MAG: Maf family nucleotide pyrophosphatase [Candidatus Omnitrophota bacterium]|jgi:MAF protein
MRKIYLASESKQRKTLFKIFGLKFRVVPAGIKEETVLRKKTTVAELVKHNALAKAEEAAREVKSGIIVAADTIVTDGVRLYGKPKGLSGARRMLKEISRKPQWVYTGIAVIDKDARKIKTSYEKTKVIMDALTDTEIDNYFRAVSPLDKAGSFDIQGKGAFFIRRIEGCYFNVVGLPLRKLFLMLKDLNVRIFSFFFCFFAFSGCLLMSGCSSEYNIVTGQEEAYYYSTEREEQIGLVISKEVEKEYKFDGDPLAQKRVEDIGQKIAAVCDRKDIRYSFKIIEDKEINAVSLPGGFVYVFTGLIDITRSDQELAGVIAHEVGHIVARHSIKKLQAVMGYSLARLLAIAIPQSGQVGVTADAAFTELMLGYGREDELLADQLAARYLKAAGYDPHGIIQFLEHFQEIERRKPARPKSYFKTHPYVPDRIRVVKEELGEKITFSDYINIEQKKHGE